MNARIWFQVHIDGSRRQRRLALQRWTRPGQAAALLAEAGDARRLALAQGRGLRVSGSPWAHEALRNGRARYLVNARDLLYAMRQARRAGVLRVRVPA